MHTMNPQLILSLLLTNLPQLWDVISTTVNAVGIHFRESSPDDRKAMVLANVRAWYRFVDKQFNFSDEQDDFMLNKMLPDMVEWIYAVQKISIKDLVAKIRGGDVEAPADTTQVQAQLQAGEFSVKAFGG